MHSATTNIADIPTSIASFSAGCSTLLTLASQA